MSRPVRADSLRDRPFVLLFVATFLFYMSFQMLLPVLPLYATAVGAHESRSPRSP